MSGYGQREKLGEAFASVRQARSPSWTNVWSMVYSVCKSNPDQRDATDSRRTQMVKEDVLANYIALGIILNGALIFDQLGLADLSAQEYAGDLHAVNHCNTISSPGKQFVTRSIGSYLPNELCAEIRPAPISFIDFLRSSRYR